MSNSNNSPPGLIQFTLRKGGGPVLVNYTHVTHITGAADKGSTIHLTTGQCIEITELHENIAPIVLKQVMAMAFEGVKMAQTLAQEMDL